MTTLHGFLTAEDIKDIKELFDGEVRFIETTHPATAAEILADGGEVGHYINCKTTHPAFERLVNWVLITENVRLVRGERMGRRYETT
jgi:hypothetical protein